MLESAEAVIISCGAPDSFDVYEASACFAVAHSSTPKCKNRSVLRDILEACFETLTKLGFAMPGIANKETSIRRLRVSLLQHFLQELLLRLLEDVHEVRRYASVQPQKRDVPWKSYWEAV